MFWKELPIGKYRSDLFLFFEKYRFLEKYKRLTKYKKRYLYGTLFITIFISSFLITYALLTISKVFVKSESNNSGNSLVNQSEISTTDPNAPINILLLGYGGAGHEGGGLTDVMMVASVNHKNDKITFISIPRDTWIELPIRSDKKEHYKINNAFAIGNDDEKFPLKEPQFRGGAGGGEMAKYAVTEAIGLPIQYFIAVDFNGFKKVVDDLGGISVEVPVAFEDYYYPIKGAENLSCGKSAEEIADLTNTLSGFELEKQFQCRYEHLQFEKGLVSMDGEIALKFVRSRHSNTHGGDFARSQRQFAVLQAVKGKLFELDSLSKWPEFFDQFTQIIRTDVDKEVLRAFLEVNNNFDSYVLSTIYLSTENVFSETKSSDGQYILIPKAGEGNFTEVHTFVGQQLNLEK